MPQPEFHDLTRAQVIEAINRCLEAFNQVKARLPKNAGYHDTQDNQHEASLAFLRQLPVLFDPQSFQLYIACIAHGASVGAIDPIDVGRFCHLAQTAMSAWKLANLVVPAAKKKEKEGHPLPSKGNHLESWGAPGPSHSGTREGRQTPSQPLEAPMCTDPLPTEGNHSEDDESRGAPGLDSETRDRRNPQDQPSQSLNQPNIPGSGMKALRQAARDVLQSLSQDPTPLDELPPTVRKCFDKRPPISAQHSPEAAQKALDEPAKTA